MKASVKLRDGQTPLIRVKLPVKLLGIPLFSSAALGNRQELALRVGTSLEAGPAFEVVYTPYTPNGLARSLSLVLKTGCGPWGSPVRAPVAMAAEFNLLSGNSPAFRLWVKPQVGDFGLSKGFCCPVPNDRSESRLPSDEVRGRTDALGSSGVVFTNNFGVGIGDRHRSWHGDTWSPTVVEADGDRLVASTSCLVDDAGSFIQERMEADWEHLEEFNSANRPSTSSTNGKTSQHRMEGEYVEQGKGLQQGLSALVAGSYLRAYTSLSISRKARVQIRWRIRQVRSDVTFSFAGFSNIPPFTVPLLPTLCVDKIKVENMVDFKQRNSPHLEDSEDTRKLAQLETLCCSMNNTLRLVQLENKSLKCAIEDMRSEIGIRNTGPKMEKKPNLELPTDEEDHCESGCLK
eukprot:c24672_g1_i1 orf=60-1271(+)